jgi:hypothetical protein
MPENPALRKGRQEDCEVEVKRLELVVGKKSLSKNSYNLFRTSQTTLINTARTKRENNAQVVNSG